jgi:hypothetical protein
MGITDWFKGKKQPQAHTNTVNKALSNPPITGFGLGSTYTIPLSNRVDYVNAVNTVPQLYATIRILYSNYGRGKYRLFQKQTNGKNIEIFEHPFLDFLANPNPIQSGKELIQQRYAFYQLDGNSFNFAGVPRNILLTQGVRWDNINTMYILPSQYTQVNSVGNEHYTSTEISEIIKNYELTCGVNLKFETSSIMHLNQVSVDYENSQSIIGDSPLVALQKPLSDIVVAYKARNVNLVEGRGVIAVAPKDLKDSLNPLEPEQIEEINAQFKEYGNLPDMHRLWPATAPYDFTKIGWSLKEMEIFEGIEDDAATIANEFGVPFILLQKKNSKFNDREVARRELFTTKLIPDAESETQALNTFFNLKDDKLFLTYTFDDIPEMQADKKIMAEVNATNTASILSINEDYQQGKITYETALQMIQDVTGKQESEAAVYLPSPTDPIQADTQIDPQKTYDRHRDAINMSYSELSKYKRDLNGNADKNSTAIDDNLHLLSLHKAAWGQREHELALNTIEVIKNNSVKDLRSYAFDPQKILI